MAPRLAIAAVTFALLCGCASHEATNPGGSGWRAEYWKWARSRHPDWPQATWDKVEGERSQGLSRAERDVQGAAYAADSLEGAKRNLEKREAASGSRDKAWADARRDHPEWPENEIQQMQDGEVWAGMTEEQFLLTMKELNPLTHWHISNSDDFRIYIDDATNDNFTFSQKTKRLKLWQITPR
jgi:hypothetical protein